MLFIPDAYFRGNLPILQKNQRSKITSEIISGNTVCEVSEGADQLQTIQKIAYQVFSVLHDEKFCFFGQR